MKFVIFEAVYMFSSVKLFGIINFARIK